MPDSTPDQTADASDATDALVASGASGASGISGASDDTESRIRDLAAQFHGVVTRAQLRHAGVSDNAIDYRLRTRRLRILFQGVYGVGPVAAQREREAAALLSCGAGAALSHLTAARLWGLGSQVDDAEVNVTAVGVYRRRIRALRVHRVSLLPPDDVTVRNGLALTTPGRTIADIAWSVKPGRLEQLVAQAERDGLADRKAILATIDRTSRRPGAARLRALVADQATPSLTRSEAEARLLALIRRGRLPPPQTNVLLHGFEVDVLWRAERLVVEVDGFEFHSSRRAFEHDRRRDNRLTSHGYRVMRITWKQLHDEPEAVLVGIAHALALHQVTRPV